MLPQIANLDAFEDLYNSVPWHNPAEMAKITRGLKGELFYGLSELEKREGSTSSSSTPTATPIGHTGAQISKEELESMRDTLKAELKFVCTKVGETTRKNHYPKTELAFEGAFFDDCDLSHAVLNGADLTDAQFQFVILDGAHLTDITGFDTTF